MDLCYTETVKGNTAARTGVLPESHVPAQRGIRNADPEHGTLPGQELHSGKPGNRFALLFFRL